MVIGFLEPDNLEDALLNCAAWHLPTYDASDDLNAVSLRFAVAVDSLFDLLHFREKNAIRCHYLQHVSRTNTRNRD